MTDSSSELPKAAKLFMDASWRAHFGACSTIVHNPEAGFGCDIYKGVMCYLGFCQTLAQAIHDGVDSAI